MGNNAVKGVIVIMLLVIASVLIGVQISGSIKESLGSFAVIALIVGFFFMVLIGKRLWMLIFLLPPFFRFIPLPILTQFHPTQLTALLVLAAWLVMSALRQVQMKWRPLPVLDIACGIVLLYMIASYYRHPVALMALGLDFDYVGGKEYVSCFMAVVNYLALSLIPIQYKDLRKVLRWSFYCTLAMSIYGSLAGMLHIGSYGAEVESEGSDVSDSFLNGRFSYFSQLGILLISYLYTRYPWHKLLTSFRHSGIIALSLFFILISGWRGTLIRFALQIFTLAIAKRELSVLFLCGSFLYAALFGLSSFNLLENAPYGMQRVVKTLPGMHVSAKAEQDTDSSSEIRKRMWVRAMDPRTGLIKDYVWGDGFGLSLSHIKRQQTAYMRTRYHDMQAYLETNGEWHNGLITYIHRLGYVGAVLIHLVLLIAAYYSMQVLRCTVCTPDGGYISIVCIGFFTHLYASSFLVLTVHTFFLAFPSIVYSKILYCMLRDEGKILPLFRTERYIPLSIQAIENAKVS